jgi:pyruvate,orthophosphate dikinase
MLGTMIEAPARCPDGGQDRRARAEFFSFGTNDLTQTTFGFSRDDIGDFLPDYLAKKILPRIRSRASIRKVWASSSRWASRRGGAHAPNLK